MSVGIVIIDKNETESILQRRIANYLVDNDNKAEQHFHQQKRFNNDVMQSCALHPL